LQPCATSKSGGTILQTKYESKRMLIKIIKMAAFLGGFCTAQAFAKNEVAGPLYVINDNGGWCWFQDERAVVHTAANKLIVGSAASTGGVNGSTRGGDIDIVSFDLASHETSRFVLNAGLQSDDHNAPAIITLPNGRYLASYSKHSSDRSLRSRISLLAGDISNWSEETVIQGTGVVAYSNLHYLAASDDLFNFHRISGRTGGFDPNYFRWNFASEPEFTFGGRLLTGPERNEGSSDRPYVRYQTNGDDRIDFITTDGHPQNILTNGVYHGYIRFEGSGRYGIYKSEGTRLGDLSAATTSPYAASDFTPLFLGNTASPQNDLLMTRGWTVDLEVDASGSPYAVFSARVNDDMTDHRFFYARYSGSRWTIHELARAGGFLYQGQDDYTGLVALDPQNPNRLFMSTNIDPRTQTTLPHYEIFRGITRNGGARWKWEPITFHSTMDNLRPIAPRWSGKHTALLWMRGSYTTYKDYNTAIVLLKVM
jgi:hypothetical protein